MMDEDAPNDEDLMQQISLELSQLDLDSHSADESDSSEVVKSPKEINPPSIETKSFQAFQVRLTTQSEAFEKQLQECAQLLHSAEDKIATATKVDLSNFVKEYGEEGEDEETFRARVFAEIEADDESDDVITDSSMDMETTELNAMQIITVPAKDADEQTRSDTIGAVTEHAQTLAIEDKPVSPQQTDHTNAIILYNASNIKALQRDAKSKMAELEKRQQAAVERENQDRENYSQSLLNRDKLVEAERQHRHELFEKEAEQVHLQTAQRESNLEQELKLSEKRIQDLSQQFEAQIYKLEKDTEAEKCRLKAEIEGISERRRLLETKAATQIQSVYRGYRVRQRHGLELKELIEEKLEAMEAERIEKASQGIEELKAQQKIQEKERLEAEEDKRRLEEEANQKELELKLAKEEALKKKLEQEAEEKRLLAEKKRREKELKEEEKRRKKEEKERLRKEKEEKKRLQREQEELEKQRKEHEELERQKKEQEERERILREQEKQKQLKLQEEKKRHKEQKKKEKAEKERLRLAQEQEKLEMANVAKESAVTSPVIAGGDNSTVVHNMRTVPVENNSQPTESQNEGKHELVLHNGEVTTADNVDDSKGEEKIPEKSSAQERKSENTDNARREMLLAQEKAEKEKKINEYKNWMEERKSKLAAAAGTSPAVTADPLTQAQPVDLSVTEAKIEERRLRWIQECTPWSQVSAKALNSTTKVKKSFKRPSSAAKKQEPIEETVILSQSGQQSMAQVEAVQLTDLPGCRLTTFSNCKRLKALSISRSGVCAIDSLNNASSLLYTHLKGNAIDSVELASLSLVHLNLSSNSLTSMRGFESCTNIRYLNLSNNRISKLVNLGCHQCLHTLDMSHNQLISTKGIGEYVTLQVLDLSANHLTSLDEVGKLCLLRKLFASNNNIMEIPRLTNSVLLENLELDDNSISSLDGLAYFWLPTLNRVNLRQNGISAIQSLHGCFNLRTLDLSHNQLIDCKNVASGLKLCVGLQELLLNGNPVSNADVNRRTLCISLPQLKLLDGHESSYHKPIAIQSEVLQMCCSCWTEFSKLDKKYQSVLSDNLSLYAIPNTELLRGVQQMTVYYSTAHNLAENVRYAHEFGSMSFETPQQPTVISSKELFEAKLAAAENVLEQPPQPNTPNAKDLFEQKLKATLESTPLKVSTENIQILRDCSSPRPSSRHGRTSRAKHESKSGTPRSARRPDSRSSVLYNGRSSVLRHSSKDVLTQQRNAAAVKIQALWRGYSFRHRLMQALQQAKAYDDEDSDDEIAEVDLSTFEFNVDDGWLPPDLPHIPQTHAVLRSRAPEMRLRANDASFTNGHIAWVPPPEDPINSGHYLDPPLSSMSGEISHRSKREELIAQDWGFKDSHTTELMMKRAKKLKYNSQHKKKLDKLGPMGRYELQKKILQNIDPPKVVAPVRKTAPKKEYFKALEEEAQKRNWAKTAEKDTAIERTYEWIHTQVDSKQPSHDEREERASSGESQLPYMDRRVLEGGRAQLVNSPLEIMSVSSYLGPSSADSRGRGQGNSTNKPPTKRQQNKQQLSKPKSTELDGYNAWGSGKKRSTR